MGGASPKRAFKEGIKLLNEGKTHDAKELFEAGLNNAVRNKDKGPLLYNIAVCQSRLGEHKIALATLDRAISATPWLRPKVNKDADLAKLRKTGAYQELRKRYRGSYVRTWKWYLIWFLGAFLLGFVLAIKSDPFDNAARFGGMSIVLAWFAGKCVEGFVAFRRGLKGQN